MGRPLTNIINMVKFSLRPLIYFNEQNYLVYSIDRDVDIKGILITLAPVERLKIPFFSRMLPKKHLHFLKPRKELFLKETLELIKDFDGDFVDRFYSMPTRFLKDYKHGQLGDCYDKHTMLHLDLTKIIND